MLLSLLIAALTSFVATLVVVRLSRMAHAVTHDHDLSGPQKFHSKPVPRIGGLAIMAGLLTAVGFAGWGRQPPEPWVWGLFACSAPVFLFGILEDLTKRVSPSIRLLSAAVSGVLAVFFLDAALTRTAIAPLDWLVAFAAGAVLVTAFVVAGVANAVNIIDGFNGLASMCVVLMLASLAYVAVDVGDVTIATLALMGVGAVLGFFVWNYPAGLIFLGDGGAYFLGFYLAELCILLLHRNPSVSPMFPLLLCIYPVFETVFSMYRRRVLRGRPAGLPDGAHLHSLIYRRFMRWAAGDRSTRGMTWRNSRTAPYLWLLCTASVVPAMLWWGDTPMLVLSILGFGLLYLWLYWGIVRFRVRRQLGLSRRRRG